MRNKTHKPVDPTAVECGAVTARSDCQSCKVPSLHDGNESIPTWTAGVSCAMEGGGLESSDPDSGCAKPRAVLRQ